MDEQFNNTEAGVWPLVERRKSGEACDEIHRVVGSLADRISTLERKCEAITTAFVKNDLGSPDIDGHRKAHIELKKAAETYEEYKTTGAKSIIQAVIAFASGIFISGLVEWFRNPK